MPAPPVQYVTTSDGYSIAVTQQGSGPLLVCLPFAFSHAQAVWTNSSATPLLLSLSRRFRVVYYDSRGQGLSQRGLPPATTADSYLLDLKAVIDTLAPERPVLLGDNPLCHVAARFAADNPERVRALVLMHCPVSLVEQVSWISNLASQNWNVFLDFHAGFAVPVDAAAASQSTSRVDGLKARTTQGDYLQFCKAFAASDASQALRRITTPTLVLHASGQEFVTQEASTRTAALIPHARLTVLGGSGFFGEPDEVVAAVEGLVAEASNAAAAKPPAPIAPLSNREIEVLKLLAAGRSNRDIASDLVISLHTVTRHISHVYAKTGAANRAQAVAYAKDRGIC